MMMSLLSDLAVVRRPTLELVVNALTRLLTHIGIALLMRRVVAVPAGLVAKSLEISVPC